MLSLKPVQVKVLLILSWVIINLIQAYFTELAHDEAYYWVYSEYLDLGYFDHPPMIAFMIKAGYLLFQNELGVRLIVVLFGSATILVLDELTSRKNFLLIFCIYTAFTCLHIYGFIATPDAPLLLFTALFFLAYKRFLEKDSLLNIILISLTIAALLYSKYHGILILFFVILSNLKLLTQKSFYAIILISVLLYLPHVLWQIENDYPSYKYHVQNRNQMPYKPLDTLNYILGFILITSPLLFPFIIKSFRAFMNRAGEKSVAMGHKFKRSLIFVTIGFTVFFLFSTLNTRAEANWNIPVLIPLAIILFWYAFNNPKAKLWVYRMSGMSLVLFALVRLHLMIDLIPSSIKIKDEFHLNQAWANDVEKIANGAPVVWSNSYQNAAKHYFYSKQPSHSHNNSQYRRNQFDLWPIADSLQGKRVLFVANWEADFLDKVNTCKGTLKHTFIDNYRTKHHVTIETDNVPKKAVLGTEFQLPITLVNNTSEPIHFKESELEKSVLLVSIQHNQKHYSVDYLDVLKGKTLTDSLHIKIPIKLPTKASKYYLRVNIKTGILPETINGQLIRLDVLEN